MDGVWGYWLLWRATGQRLDFGTALMLPEWMLAGILELDSIYHALDEQKKKDTSQDAPNG